jgi:hypothetical protein
MEPQKTSNIKNNPEQKKQQRKYQNTCLQTILQNRRNKNCMVLAQKQIRRPVEQNRRWRNKPSQLLTADF